MTDLKLEAVYAVELFGLDLSLLRLGVSLRLHLCEVETLKFNVYATMLMTYRDMVKYFIME